MRHEHMVKRRRIKQEQALLLRSLDERQRVHRSGPGEEGSTARTPKNAWNLTASPCASCHAM